MEGPIVLSEIRRDFPDILGAAQPRSDQEN